MTQSRSSAMSPDRFIEYLQNCFSDVYHPDMAATIRKYLADVTPLYVSALAAVCVKRHPRQYRTAPGIAEFEKYGEEAYQQYQQALQSTDRLQIAADAGDEVDVSQVIDSLARWAKERSTSGLDDKTDARE